MAKSVPVDAAPVRAEERTWRTNIETPEPAGSIQFYRETVGYDAEDNVVSRQQSMTPLNGQLADIADNYVELADGTQITMAQIIEALSLFADNWPEQPPGLRR